MSYRATILSPLPTYGLGTMPGSSSFTTYSSSYNSRRGSSASRKYDTSGGSSSGYGTSVRPGLRPLPVGPGPLDHTGKKLGSYTASDIRKTSTGSTRGPLRADHSSYLTGGSSKYDYTPSIGTLPRKYSSSNANTALNNTTKDTSLGSRGVRSRSVSNVDKVTENLTQVKLNGYDSVKASPRITDSDDSISGARESRKDINKQNLNEINNCSSSRFSHTSKSTLNNNDERFLTPRNRDSTGRTSSIQRNIDNKQQENNSGIPMSLSRQSSSSSMSEMSEGTSTWPKGAWGPAGLGLSQFEGRPPNLGIDERPLYLGQPSTQQEGGTSPSKKGDDDNELSREEIQEMDQSVTDLKSILLEDLELASEQARQENEEILKATRKTIGHEQMETIANDSKADLLEKVNKVPEVFENDPSALKLFEGALQDGKENDNSARVNIVGNYNQGKTTLLRQLLGQSSDTVSVTNGIEVHKCECLKTSEGKSVFQTKESDEQSYLPRILSVALCQTDNSHSSPFINDFENLRDTETSGGIEAQESLSSHVYYGKEDNNYSESSAETSIDRNRNQQSDETSKSFHSLMLTNEEQDRFITMIRNTTLATNEKSQKTISFWDNGGQFVFYATHALFHSRAAVYLLVFDLSIPLNQVVDDNEYPIKGEKKTVRYYLEFWINSIHSFVGSEDGSQPVVILVGTHRDQIGSEKKDEYMSQVRDIFKELGVISHIHPVHFAVDNTCPNDPEIAALREEITDIIDTSSKSEEIPAKWMQLEKLLAMKKNEKVIRFHEVQQIDATSAIPLHDAEQIKLFLRYHHEKGTYIYFDEPAFCDYVIVDPQFLVDAFKSIITCERFFTNFPAVDPLWTKLQSQARLEQTLIDMQWSKDTSNMFMVHKDILLRFLIKHHIISEATRYDEDSQGTERLGWYVVPSLLREITPEDELRAEEFVKLKPKTALKFVMKFKISTTVQLVFHRMLAAVIDKWSVLELKAKPADRRKKPMIFQNLAIVNLQKHHAGIAEWKGNCIELSIINLCSSGGRVDCEQASRFRRFSESVVTHEFRKLKRNEELSKPYSIHFRCNDPCHGLTGSLETLQTEDLDKELLIPCPDNDTHIDINTRSAKDVWFPRVQKSVPKHDFVLSPEMLSTIAQSIGKNWHLLGLKLKLSQVDIDHIEMNNSNNTVMKIYNMLWKWKANSEFATFNQLLAVMQRCTNVNFDWDKIENFRDDVISSLVEHK